MNTIKINILKKSVMGVVEGLTTTIAAHNPDVDFETIWASDSEEPKLDIYYREAIQTWKMNCLVSLRQQWKSLTFNPWLMILVW